MQAENGLKAHPNFKNRAIVVDFDGVLGNIHQHLNHYLSTPEHPFDGDHDIYSWSMKELAPVCRRKIFGLFADPRFMSTVPLFPQAIPALQILSELSSRLAVPLLIQTSVCSAEVGEARKHQLMNLRASLNINFEILVNIDQNKNGQKVPISAVALFEDKPENLKQSNALFKVLIRRGHNRSCQIQDLGPATCRYIAHDILEGAHMVQNWIESGVN